MPKSNIKVGIIAAMEKEAEHILSEMKELSTEKISGITFYSGKYGNSDCVLAVCGIGKVFAALCAQTMIIKYSPDLIINSGVAGGLSPKLSIGDIAIASALVQHDMDTSPLGDPVGMISGINRVLLPTSEKYTALLGKAAEAETGKRALQGVIASGDKFICSEKDKERIRSSFDAVACEMEGAAIAHVCFVNGVDCCVMRAISDGGDEDAVCDYPTFAKAAAKRASRVIDRFFSMLEEC